MRWFIVLLLLANLGLFFWLQHDSLPDVPVAALPPPDVGRLQLLNDNPAPAAPVSPNARFPEIQPFVAGGQDIAPEAAPEPVVPAVSAPELATPESAPQQQESSTRIAAEIVAEEKREEAVVDRPEEPSTLTSKPAEPDVSVDTARSESAVTAVAVAPAMNAESVSPEQSRSDEPLNTAKVPSAPPVGDKLPEADIAVTEPSCALVGPMTNEAADVLIGRLPAFVDLLSDMTVEVRDVDAYYVMIPPLPSRAAGLAMLKRLEAEGITDTWLFPRGVYRNAISLGLFSRKAGAERHLRRVNQQGFEAELIEKGRRQERRQLLVKNVDGGDVALSLPLPEGVVAEKTPCP